MKKYLIILTVLLIILFLIYIIQKKKNYSLQEDFGLKYTKCPSNPVRGIMKDIFDKNDIHLDKNWDIYIPCGYNGVENELTKVYPDNNKQIIFGISGCDQIVSKNNIWYLLETKYGREKASQIMPETYILSRNKDIKKLILDYKPNKKYILKKNVQRKKGILLTKNLKEILNAKNDGFKVVQIYLENIFLINKRKLNLRIYVLLKCQFGNIETYVHKQGKCIYTNKDYDENDLDFEKNITSYNLDLDIYKINPLTFKDLKVYFQKNNLDYDLFFKRVLEIIKLTIKASKNQLCNLNNIYNNVSFQLFGIDVVLDNNLNPYLLEFNKGPDMVPKNEIDRQIKTKVEEDMFDLVNIVKSQNNEFILIN